MDKKKETNQDFEFYNYRPKVYPIGYDDPGGKLGYSGFGVSDNKIDMEYQIAKMQYHEKLRAERRSKLAGDNVQPNTNSAPE
jgi:hypothetical protein